MSLMSLSSAHAFIRALKAPSDPPPSEHRRKIELAREAWNTPSLYIPSKSEVLVDWLLSQLLKNPDLGGQQPLLDVRYWALLIDILHHDNAKIPRPWLLPILNRIPAVPILSAFLAQLHRHPQLVSPDVLGTVTRCYAILWPLAVPKANHDAIIDCFWALLPILASPSEDLKSFDVEELGGMIAEQFSTSFAISPSKRKICTTFMSESHLDNWVHAATQASPRLRAAVSSAVSDLLFSVDGIRHLILVPDTADDSFFNKLSALDPVAVFAEACLPDLFSSFSQAVRKHRAALFAEGSNATGSRANTSDEACVAFFRSCIAYIGRRYDSRVQWPAYVNLVNAVRGGNLYSRGSVWRTELVALALKAAVAVDAGAADAALALLTCLLRLDYDLVSDVCPGVLKKIAVTESESLASALEFASSALEYACKTRTVDDHLIVIVACLKEHEFDAKLAYERVCRGVFFSHAWRTQMNSAVTIFLSPGQAARLATELLSTVQAEWELVCGRLRTPAKKKATSSSHQDLTVLVLHLHYVSEVLSALFVRSMSSAGGASDEHLSRLALILDEIDASLNAQSVSSWEYQTLQACTLRCRYGLSAVWSSPATSVVPLAFDVLYKADAEAPELRVELDRTLLRLLPVLGDQGHAYLNTLLQRLERDVDADTLWNGSVCIPAGEKHGMKVAAVAVWSSILLRWLPTLDMHATQDHLRRLVALIFHMYRAQTDVLNPQYTAPTLLRRALGDAAFWELRNVGTCVVEQLQVETAALADVDPIKAAKRLKSKKKGQLAPEDLERALEAFRFALGTPPAVLSKASREELLERAFTADMMCTTVSQRTDVRRCIARHAAHGFATLPTEVVTNFLDCDSVDTDVVPEFADATLQVADVLFARAIADKSNEVLEPLVSHFSKLLANYAQRSHLSLDERLLRHLVQQLPRSPVPADCVQKLLHAVAAYVDETGSRLQRSTDKGNILDVVHSLGLATAARRASQRLNVILSIKLDVATSLLPQVINALQTSPELRSDPGAPSLCSTLLVLLLDEISHTADHAAVVVAAFATFHRLFGRDAVEAAVDAPLAETVKELPVSSYQRVLEELQDAILSLPKDRVGDICATIHLSTLLCRGVPEGASKLARDHARVCLMAFANHGLPRHENPSIRLQVLRLVETLCKDRPMSLQVQDVGQVWLLLAQALSPCTVHDETTSIAHFQTIVAAATSLVRLRRDLVASTLPHITHVVRLLIGALRAPRPQLGAKQLREVCNGLPRFVAARADGSGRLGADEARALARLMTGLNTKTTVVGRSDDRTPASLARPFARHAPGVLLAYVQAASAPLSVLSLPVRRELEPGIFALCAMSGEHGRDSVMAGTAGATLDAAGKAVFKTVWKEFEKQKYVGTG